MTRPGPDVIARVDALVAQLDADTIDEPYVAPATSSYEVIVSAWERFKATVDGLDCAVGQPFAEGAASTLISARALADVEFDELMFWLGHVGEALMHGSSGTLPPSSA